MMMGKIICFAFGNSSWKTNTAVTPLLVLPKKISRGKVRSLQLGGTIIAKLATRC
jgi:hypothetical protein